MPAEIENAEVANVAAWWDTKGEYVHDGLMSVDYVKNHPAINWPVKKYPVPNPITGFPTEYYLLMRETDGAVFNCVTDRYEPFQNEELVEFLVNMVDSSDLEFESVLSLKGGAIVALCARTPDHIEIAGEQYLPYMTGANWHDSSRLMMVNFSTVRTVCRNTLNAGIAAAPNVYYFRHVAGMHARVIEARETLQMGFKYTDEIVKIGEKLAVQKVTGSELDNFLKAIVPDPPKRRKRKSNDFFATTGSTEVKAAEYQQALARVIKTRDGIKRVYSDTPDLENIRGTAWGMVQAVAAWNDHERSFRNADNRFESVVLSRSDFTERAINYALTGKGTTSGFQHRADI